MRIIDDARICLIFFTRIPITWPEDLPRERITRAFKAAPIAGLVVGIIGALAYALAFWLFKGSVHLAATVAVAAQVLATGAFHEDGFADFWDGLGGGKTAGERIEIMRDSRIGTFGGLALLLATIMKIFLIAEIAQVTQVGLCLIVAGVFSRAALVQFMALVKPALGDGLSAEAGQPTGGEAATATLMGAVIGIVAMLLAFELSFGGPMVGALIGAVTGTLVIALVANRYLGGQNGDALGASAIAAELGGLIGIVALIPGFGM
jgi:adenosylcobinamide-GDP ribazoletransferase